MANTPCFRRMKEGMMVDLQHIDFRLDSIEARIDDLCGLLGEVLERIDQGKSLSEITTEPPPMDLTIPESLWDS